MSASLGSLQIQSPAAEVLLCYAALTLHSTMSQELCLTATTLRKVACCIALERVYLAAFMLPNTMTTLNHGVAVFG